MYLSYSLYLRHKSIYYNGKSFLTLCFRQPGLLDNLVVVVVAVVPMMVVGLAVVVVVVAVAVLVASHMLQVGVVVVVVVVVWCPGRRLELRPVLRGGPEQVVQDVDDRTDTPLGLPVSVLEGRVQRACNTQKGTCH